jgi:hypothetical protein
MPPPPHTVYEHWKGRYVRFHLGDVYLLDPEPVRALELKGRVVDVSHDSRGGGSIFAIVEVDSISKPCIVPIERIQPAEPNGMP